MESTDAALIFGALSQEARLAVLRLLIAAGPTGLPAGVIAEAANSLRYSPAINP